MKAEHVGIILLAAGSSSRLGQPKQLLPFDGKSLIQRAIDTAYETCGLNTVVVLGSEAEKHRQHLSSPLKHIIVNKHWQAGMGSSLKSGLGYLVNYLPHVESIIVMVCDQPLLKKEHLFNLIKAHHKSNAPVVASAYKSTHGVPALFDKTLFNALLQLEDNHGAKKIIEANLHSAEIVEFPEGAIDIDTPDDLKQLA